MDWLASLDEMAKHKLIASIEAWEEFTLIPVQFVDEVWIIEIPTLTPE